MKGPITGGARASEVSRGHGEIDEALAGGMPILARLRPFAAVEGGLASCSTWKHPREGEQLFPSRWQ